MKLINLPYDNSNLIRSCLFADFSLFHARSTSQSVVRVKMFLFSVEFLFQDMLFRISRRSINYCSTFGCMVLCEAVFCSRPCTNKHLASVSLNSNVTMFDFCQKHTEYNEFYHRIAELVRLYMTKRTIGSLNGVKF